MATAENIFEPVINGEIYSACPHDCPDACSIISHVKNGRLHRITGNPDHPVTQGFLCKKFSNAPQRIYGSDRLTYPLQRTGSKGKGSFRRISWEQAIDSISGQWKEIIKTSGPQGILPFYGSGTEGLINGRIAGKRFFNRLGTLQLDRTICTKNGREGYRYTMGTSMGADPTAIANNKLIVAWGCNTSSTNIHHQTFLKEARNNGAVYAVINPVRIRGAESAEIFLQPRPGSDAALALGMMHVIIREGLFDPEFIGAYTLGFDELKQHVLAYPPKKVAQLTDIPEQDIIKFARLYAQLNPSFIYVGPGCQRHNNGGMTLRTIACLPALSGAWRHKGSGLYFPTSTIFPVDTDPLEGEDLRPVPASRYNMIELTDRLDQRDSPIRSLYIFNGNPATVLYNQNRLRKQLLREDLFTVVHDQYLTDTARYADIVLPATTQFEQTDLMFSYYHFSVLLNRQAIAPVGECRSNLETFRLLAAAMDFNDPCFYQDSWDIIREILAIDHPALTGVTLEKLQARGWSRANLDGVHTYFENGGLPTPSGKIEFYSEAMRQKGWNPLPCYLPPRESRESNPQLFRQYPLYFLTPSTHASLNSNYAQYNGKEHREFIPDLLINKHDALARHIANGDLVRVYNGRGCCYLHARVGDSVRTGVVVSHGLWWDMHYPRGCNANHTTPDFTGEIGGGSSFNTNLVEVSPVSDKDGLHVSVS